VHIEPRHELRGRGARLGVVEQIAAPHRHELTVDGEAGHAGEVAMADREEARRHPATVATVGRLEVEPGAISVIPARVRAALEVRGIDAGAIAAVEAALDDAGA